MAFVNLPPNFQDMFYSITDRIAKLETGPNQAMYTAESAQGSSAQALYQAQQATIIAVSAQSVATNAQVQAINAGIQANNAASQATIAQSQATIASSQATAAQVTANGKNKVYYSTSGPGSTANTVGDIWYQYGTSGTYANKVIAQFSGAGGTSWTSVTVSGLVIANIDAGSITTGTLSAITISAGTGANAFNVSSSGVMSAQGAWIKGNITADSGTFNGTVNAATGYFGNLAGGNYWSIGASGLTGVGSAVITGGLIQGSSITVPNSASWKFAVDSAGSLQAVNANITGTIFASSGTIGGWNLSGTAISKTVGTKTLSLDSTNAIITINDSSTGILSGGGINMTAGSVTGSYGAGGFAIAGTGTAAITYSGSGDLIIQGGATTGITLRPGAGLGLQVQVEGALNSLTGSISAGNVSGSATTLTAGAFMGSGGTLISRRDNATPLFASRFNASGTAEMIRLTYNGSDAGGITTTSGGVPAFRNASDYRLKQNIENFDSAASLIKQIQLRSFEFIKDPEEPQIGFIAHELAEVLPALVMGEKDAIDEDGNPAYQSILATNLIPYLTGALKEAILRIEALEGE